MQGQQTITVERVDHIGIRVRDLDRALNFYRALGFNLLHRATGDDVAIARNDNGVELNLIFNANASNQFRMATSLRQDYYQIPIDPDPNSSGNQVYSSYGLRDSEREPEGYVTFSWLHTFNPNVRMTVSPFYHYNQASYNASPNDVPVITNVSQTSDFVSCGVGGCVPP